MSNATLDRIGIRSIKEEAEARLNAILDKKNNKHKGGRKPSGEKKEKSSPNENGRDIVLDPNDGMNFFNAKVCALKIARLTKGSINSAKINIGKIEIKMVKLPKKREFDPVRYSVIGGGKKEIAAVKSIAREDFAERAVLAKNIERAENEALKANPSQTEFEQLLTK